MATEKYQDQDIIEDYIKGFTKDEIDEIDDLVQELQELMDQRDSLSGRLIEKIEAARAITDEKYSNGEITKGMYEWGMGLIDHLQRRHQDDFERSVEE